RAGHDGVRAEVEQGFYRIRPAFENRVVDVVRRAVPRARRRAERLALATDSLRGHLPRQKLPAFHAVHLGFGEDHVAAGTVDVADQRVERRDRAARLRRVGVLADAVPHIHADRPVVRENLRGLPRLFRRNSRDRRRPVGAELRGNARERRQRRLAWNLARDAANYLLAEEQWPRAIVFRRRGGGIVDNGPVGYLVPHDVALARAILRQIGFGERRAVVPAQQESSVRPAAQKLGVVPALLQNRMNQRQRERAVAAGADLQMHVRLAREADAPRIDRDELHAAPAGGDEVVRHYERGRARVVAP